MRAGDATGIEVVIRSEVETQDKLRTSTVSTLSNASVEVENDPDLPVPASIGWWAADKDHAQRKFPSIDSALHDIDMPVYVLTENGKEVFASGGTAVLGTGQAQPGMLPIRALLPPLRLRDLGDPGFCLDHGVLLPYMTGSMANGIASVRLVEAVANSGLLASFGAAGLTVDEIEQAIIRLKSSLKDKPFCTNLIHSPNERGQEQAVVDLYLRHNIHLVEASAYMALTLPVVQFRTAGIHRDQDGNIVTPNRIIAKASRTEVATQWFSPPPEKLLAELLAGGKISPEQAELARQVPMAQDLTVEADSGGHTDNRPAITLLPAMITLRDRMQARYHYAVPLRVGAAGGIATPGSAAAAFAMGAAYIVTGSINQACTESGSSDSVRKMLAEAQQADVAMAPAVDMFEMGVKLQVLKRGTMFAMRGNKLYELYRSYPSLEDIPQTERDSLEKTIFKAPLEKIWENTRSFFLDRDPAAVERAESDRKYKMALVFRWYLGLSSRWANAGEADRQLDYQIWCGPAMGAFNEWVKDTPLEKPENRHAVDIGLNLMYGAALVSRVQQLRTQGVIIPPTAINTAPVNPSLIEKYLN